MWPYYWISPLTMLTAWLRGGEPIFNWAQFENRRVILTHLARQSIVLAYKTLNLAPGDEVLVPSYNCGSEIDPLLWCGARPVFYRVDSCAAIDPEEIKARVTANTRAIYITHFFGWPHDISELAAWCKKRELVLIEDCALALFSSGPDGPLGRLGDAAIYSLWKTMPIPAGGALVLPQSNAEQADQPRTPDFTTSFRRVQPFIKKWLRHQGKSYLGSFYEALKNQFGKSGRKTVGQQSSEKFLELVDMPPSYYYDEKMQDYGIMRLAKALLCKTDPAQIIQQRRRNYRQLYEALCDLPGARPLYHNLPEGVCPLVLPLVVDEPQKWYSALAKREVVPLRWWYGYHRQLSWEDFPEAAKLKSHTLAFPVHQHLDEETINHLANQTVAVAKEVG